MESPGHGPPNVPYVAPDVVSDDGNQTEEYPTDHIMEVESASKKACDDEMSLGSSNFRHGDNHREGNRSSLIWSIHQRRKKDRKEDAFYLYLPEDWVPKTIEGHPAYARFIERNKGKAVSVEERSGMEKVVSMSSEISDHGKKQEGSEKSTYDSTRKLLPINLEKQMEQIPFVEENTDVWANIICLDRDYSRESDPRIPRQQETSSPTRSLSADLNQARNSQPEGQNNTKIGDPKKCRWFNLFPWWQKK